MTTYKDAGVDIDAQDEAISRIKKMVKGTDTRGVLSKVGNFGGLFNLKPYGFKDPVLVSSSDGVGTKVKLASLTGKYDTVGQDLVNHCVNDILVQGARPLFFMDYIASSKLDPDTFVKIIKGFTTACKKNSMTLLGGEMAEMPGVYKPGHFDLAGFIVGAVEKKKIVDGKKIRPGDIIVGFPSNGLMTNGYSLAIKVFKDNGMLKKKSRDLMKIHPSYIGAVYPRLKFIKGMAHITGGGLVDNIPRVLPKKCSAIITKNLWNIPKIFDEIQKLGKVPEVDMFRTFNMGIGYVVIIDKKYINNFKHGSIIGRIAKGSSRVIIKE
jgi:phosphoribosylformylglycinamidine cyclo-ligase